MVGLGAISDSFVFEKTRLGTVFNFNLTIILDAKEARNSLMICERSGRYLKDLETILLYQDVLNRACKVDGFLGGTFHFT